MLEEQSIIVQESRARANLMRGVAMYGAFFLLACGALGTLITTGIQGAAYVWLVVILGVGALLAHQVWQHARDLRSQPVEVECTIGRKWQRAELIIVWQSFYIQSDRRIFRLDPLDYVLVEPRMSVRITHFPRTLTVVRVERLKK